MPTSHAAVRHGVSWGKARRAEQAFLAMLQKYQYELLCHRLHYEPGDIDFSDYLEIWWDSTYLTHVQGV